MFQAGSKPGYKKNVTFVILSDRTVERTERFKLNLLHGGPLGTINNLGNATVNIYDQTGKLLYIYMYRLYILSFCLVVTVGFETSNYFLHEGTSFHEVCIFVKGGQLDRPVDLTLFSTDGTAITKSDYVGLSPVVFEPGDGENICLDIKIINDLVVERNETFTLTLVSNDTALHVISQNATVVIIDDDQVTFSFVQSTYTVSEEKEQLEISIQLLGGQGLDREIVLHLESSDGTASSDDYTAFNKALTFPRGSLSDTILPFVINIHDDSFVEEVEFFTVQIMSTDSAVQSQITKDSVTIFIEDNDCKFPRKINLYWNRITHLYAAIALIVDSSTYSVAEGEMVEVCVSVESGELYSTVELSVFSQPISAQEEDYKTIFLSLSLWPDERRVCFFIETMDDDTVEGEEAFLIILSSQHPSVTIATPGLAIINIEDDDGIETSVCIQILI